MPDASKGPSDGSEGRSAGEPPPALNLPRFDAAPRLRLAQAPTRLQEVVEFGPNPGRLRMYAVGVSGMRVRLEQLQGSLEIDAGPAGSRVTATVPLAQ